MDERMDGWARHSASGEKEQMDAPRAFFFSCCVTLRSVCSPLCPLNHTNGVPVSAVRLLMVTTLFRRTNESVWTAVWASCWWGASTALIGLVFISPLSHVFWSIASGKGDGDDRIWGEKGYLISEKGFLCSLGFFFFDLCEKILNGMETHLPNNLRLSVWQHDLSNNLYVLTSEENKIFLGLIQEKYHYP